MTDLELREEIGKAYDEYKDGCIGLNMMYQGNRPPEEKYKDIFTRTVLALIAPVVKDRDELRKAMEFAGFMKTAAIEYMNAVDNTHIIYGEDGEAHDADDIIDAEQVEADHYQGLQSAIYEFDKRAPCIEAKVKEST